MSEHPLGPFEKASNNPVLEKNVEKGGIVTGTGHNSVTWSKDGKQMYCVYHGRTQKTGDERVVFIDKMRINENGLLVVEAIYSIVIYLFQQRHSFQRERSVVALDIFQ